jgi:hypothetical protein
MSHLLWGTALHPPVIIDVYIDVIIEVGKGVSIGASIHRSLKMVICISK